jgi:Flp pilus assembly protein TadD
MNIPSISELQPYFSAIAALLSVATLAFVINIARLMSEAAKARAEVLEERLKGAQDELQRHEKWNERKVQELTAEMARYKNQLSSSLSDAGINFETLLLGRSTKDLGEEIRLTVEQTLSKMQGTLNKISEASQIDNPGWHLELAKGLMATGEWMQAAGHFEKYVQYDPLNWEIQFSRAISYANSRGGRSTDLSALRAINEAIALASEDKDLDDNLRARLFSYRGAALKRLGRLDEAESDLGVAAKFARQDYEILDIDYNRACVYALRKQRGRLLDTILSIRQYKKHPKILAAIRSHLHDYFAAFAHDEEFLKLLHPRDVVSLGNTLKPPPGETEDIAD